MAFESLEDLFAHYGRLPDELKVVWDRNWDDTGRPIRDPIGLHLDLLNMCSMTSYADYKAKFLLLHNEEYPTEKDERMLQEYWTIFIEGSKALARMIQEKWLE